MSSCTCPLVRLGIGPRHSCSTCVVVGLALLPLMGVTKDVLPNTAQYCLEHCMLLGSATPLLPLATFATRRLPFLLVSPTTYYLPPTTYPYSYNSSSPPVHHQSTPTPYSYNFSSTPTPPLLVLTMRTGIRSGRCCRSIACGPTHSYPAAGGTPPPAGGGNKVG